MASNHSVAPTLAIGIDVGGTTTRAGLVDSRGRVISFVARPTLAGEEGVVTGTVAAVDELIGRASVRLGQVECIGVGIPGVVDPSSGIVRNAVNLGLDDRLIHLGAILSARFQRPLTVHNDVNVAALGAARELGLDEELVGRRGGIVYLGIGTGIAAAWVLDGAVWTGSTGAAGEIGHISIDPNGPLCECGQRGCIEAVSSGGAVARRWPTDTGSPLEHLMTSARAGHVGALEVWDSVIGGLASAVSIVVASIDPDAVVLGGGLASHGVDIVPAVSGVLRERAEHSAFLRSLDAPARLRCVRNVDHVGVIGAVIAAASTSGDGR